MPEETDQHYLMERWPRKKPGLKTGEIVQLSGSLRGTAFYVADILPRARALNPASVCQAQRDGRLQQRVIEGS